MVEWEQYKMPLITIGVITGVLMLMVAVGFTIGILSEDPDGLEKSIIDYNGEEWLEGLPSPWEPPLGIIENDYIAGIIGIILAVVIMMVVFYMIIKLKKK